jgi:cyclohexyl-isocyanide hydratase
MLIFDGMTNLDFVGPHDIFARMPGTKILICSPDGKPVKTDLGEVVHAEKALADITSTDIFFVGGGPGINNLLRQSALLDHVAKIGQGAAWVTSVCTGALILGAAGLLEGYRAATHWTAMEILSVFGATPTYERVVVDRNRVTGGGVTAGIDFGLILSALLNGEDVARLQQLAMEYAPAPPFESGSPATASKVLVEKFRSISERITTERRNLAEVAWKERANRSN